MAWIESNQEVGRHPKTKKLARLLDSSVVAAVGHLHYLWWWAMDFAQDGNISKYDEFEIAEACLWEGEPNEFVDALIQSGLVDRSKSGLFIHDWIDYAGRLIIQKDIKKEQTRERVKRYREKTTKPCNADVTQPVEQGVTLCNAPTVPNLTVPNLNIINNINTREGEVDPELREANQVIGTQAVNWAEQNWGRMIPKGDADSILAWCDEFSARGSVEPDAVVIAALKCCLDADVRNMKYLRAVLTDWRESGILSVDQIKQREAVRKIQKDPKRNKNPGGKLALASSSKYDTFYL